jgi:DNA-binding response OmpR family regulator
MSANRTPARLIVVEDSFPVAHNLKSLLETMQFDVVGMAGDVRRALALVKTLRFDLALLDIDLHGEHVGAVADAIVQRGKSIIFLSGYGDADVLPEHLRGLPRLEKPVDPSELHAAIAAALRYRV